jgi:hypothetical protein
VHISVALELATELPSPPPLEPHYRQGDLIAYYLADNMATAHMPRFAQLQMDLGAAETSGRLLPAALTTYGVLEDILAISLSPHLRRQGRYLIHAFAAASDGWAILLVGGIGSGKTTSGLALLNAGWQLLANDSPALTLTGEVLSYPGALAAFPDSLARFPATAALADAPPAASGRQKISFAAEAVWPEVWAERAPLAAIFFPAIEPRAEHAAEPLTPPLALRRLLPHAVEQWDRAQMPAHLEALSRAVERAPAYVLHLGPDVAALPSLLAGLLPAMNQ